MRFELLAQGKDMYVTECMSCRSACVHELQKCMQELQNACVHACMNACMQIKSDCIHFDHRSEAGNDREPETVSAEQTQVLLRCG